MKTCLSCGLEFGPANNKEVYCSPRCRQKAYRLRVAAKLQKLEEYEAGETVLPPPTVPLPEVPKAPPVIADPVSLDLPGLIAGNTSLPYGDYLKMAPLITDKEGFKSKVQADRTLTPRQREMIYSKLM